MPQLERLDTLSVTVLAEDSVQYESPLWGQHGISLFVTAEKDGITRNVLVDVAQDPTALLHNFSLLKIDPTSIDTIVLTHCHYDHTQGLTEVLKAIGKKDLPIVAHPELFRLDFIVHPYLRHVGVMAGDLPKSIEENGGRLFLTSDPLQIMPGLSTTGQVKRQTDFEEVGIPLRTISKEGRLVQDSMPDDLSLVATLKTEEVVILTGCSHAGIVNIVKHTIDLTGSRRIKTVIGGLHLVEAPMERIRKTAEALASLEVETVFAGHCTGFDAQVELRKVFGTRFKPLQTGMQFMYS